MILKLNHFVLQFLFFYFALKIMLLFGEIWHSGHIWVYPGSAGQGLKV